jgi:hypothetical protein
MRSACKVILVLLIIGTLVSSQQIAAESVFAQKRHVEYERLVLTPPDFSLETNPHFTALAADTMETFDIEVEEEGDRSLYKEIAVFLIVGAAVGYIVYLLIKPDEEEGEDTNGGKEPPVTPAVGVSIPITR